ncbi:HTH domain-containing protein [Pseudomonas sp. LPD2]|uniref:HTH domain-containing protein n=1 Tax=Pseudomonas sp. LPD2 TaxID=3135229 RepID=UPI0032554E86
MGAIKDWQKKAHIILDEHILNKTLKRITQASLAKEIGISRQTLWRDKSVMDKFERYRISSRSAPQRKTTELRIAELEATIAKLKNENGILILNFILACNKLRENNHDPRLYFTEIAADIQRCFPSFAPDQLYDQYQVT